MTSSGIQFGTLMNDRNYARIGISCFMSNVSKNYYNISIYVLAVLIKIEGFSQNCEGEVASISPYRLKVK
jgi:hypothetical protein